MVRSHQQGRLLQLGRLLQQGRARQFRRLLGWGICSAVGVSLVGCLQDFDRFQVDEAGVAGAGTGARPGDGGSTGDGGTPNGSGGAQTGGDGNGGTGGSSGGDGTGGKIDDGCALGTKRCGGECVPDDQPETGCAATSCDPCPSRANAAVGCDAGQCAVLGCDFGFVDCDGEGGCEHSESSFDQKACGGCNADCTSQGFSVCSGGRCGCGQASQCQGPTATKDFACNAGRCACEGKTCNGGEICERKMGSTLCSCNGGGACSAGWTCCPQGGCKDLSGNDSANCGACGWQCPAGTTCQSGSCL